MNHSQKSERMQTLVSYKRFFEKHWNEIGIRQRNIFDTTEHIECVFKIVSII